MTKHRTGISVLSTFQRITGLLILAAFVVLFVVTDDTAHESIPVTQVASVEEITLSEPEIEEPTINLADLEYNQEVLSLLQQEYSVYGCPQQRAENFGEYKIYYNVTPERSLGNYIPPNLVNIDRHVPIKYDRICLDKLAATHLELMVKDAQEDSVDLVVTSGYRGQWTQAVLFENSDQKTDGSELLRVAPPEHSEHQLGTAVDFTSSEIRLSSADARFGTTAAKAWLDEHAHNYGWVMSYPENKTDITGVIYEPWHWRFVGVDIARSIKERGVTPTEFLAQFDE